jgi:hypothetical protein
MKLDAYEISDKIKKYWCALYPKNSGEINKTKKQVKVVVMTDEGYREVVGVHIQDDFIQLELDKE